MTVLVAGVGMTSFVKPGRSDPYDVMAASAVRDALADAGLEYSDVQQAYAGFVFCDSTAGQRVFYHLGLSGIPIINVNNNCSTGSTALFLARQAVETGAADCVIAVGFEEMEPGPFAERYRTRVSPLEKFTRLSEEIMGETGLPIALHYFAGAGLSHMTKYGTRPETFAKIRVKASRHAKHNPLAIFQRELTVEEVLNSAIIGPGGMTRLMACPPTSGAAAAVLVSTKFARKRGIAAPVRIKGQAMVTDLPSTFEHRDMIKVVGYDLAKDAATQVYEASGTGPQEIDVAEVHDCFAQNELLSYEALGFCPEGGGERFVQNEDNTYGGKTVVNPSGGLLSKGHPLGATGLAQCHELTCQLRGTAGSRQVEGARRALQHNIGLGGACVVTLYER